MLAASLLASCQLSVSWLQRHDAAAASLPPQQPLASLPLTLGDWTGDDIEIDDRLAASVGAVTQLNRRYTDGTGGAVVLHMSVFNSRRFSVSHLPRLCYTSAGWNVTGERRDRDRKGPGGTVMSCNQTRNAVVVYYWYQLGDQVGADRDSLRSAFQTLRGTPGPRPPLVKVMLQASTLAGSEPALNSCRTLGQHVHNWLKEYE